MAMQTTRTKPPTQRATRNRSAVMWILLGFLILAVGIGLNFGPLNPGDGQFSPVLLVGSIVGGGMLWVGISRLSLGGKLIMALIGLILIIAAVAVIVGASFLPNDLRVASASAIAVGAVSLGLLGFLLIFVTIRSLPIPVWIYGVEVAGVILGVLGQSSALAAVGLAIVGVGILLHVTWVIVTLINVAAGRNMAFGKIIVRR